MEAVCQPQALGFMKLLDVRRHFVFLVVLWGIHCAAAQTSAASAPLTLRQAVSIALEKNPLRKAALADTKAALAEVRVARSSLMPHLTLSETGTRGNDPVYVFGSKLRQQRFTTTDFALNKLNTPLPFGNFATRFGGSWNLFDSFASWHAVSRARLMNDAAAHQLDRTDQEIVFRVIDAYYGTLLARKQLEVATQAEETAQAILDRSQTRFDSGLVVESDVLTAKVRMASRSEELARAHNNLEMARAQLNIALGEAADSPFKLVEALEQRALPIPDLSGIETQALENRPDLRRIQSEEAAQQQGVAMAKSAFGPRVNAVAGWELDNPTLVAGGGGNNWLGAIEVQFDLFQGGAQRATLARERALAEKVTAMKQAASDAIRLEVRHAYYDLDSARQEVTIAQLAVAQAQESLRINQDRYDGGLITITDLLGVEETSRRTQAEYWEATYRLHISFASLELASGTLNAQSPVVTP
jgi:outer membrane protein